MADDFAMSIGTPDRVLSAQVRQIFDNNIINDLNIEDIDPSNSYAFPREADGTTRIRYPAGLVHPNSAPASTTLTNGNMSLMPYFIASNITASSISAKGYGFTATSGGSGLVGLYSAPTGLSNASLVASTTYTLASSGSIQYPTVSLTLASGELQRGWYVLAASNTAGTVSNAGNCTIYNLPIFGSSSANNPVGTYFLSTSRVITGVTSALPSTLTGSTEATAAAVPSFFLIY